MSIGIQITALVFILATLTQFLSKKRISLISTKLFTSFLVIAALNITFELITLYTINNLETIPSWTNRLAHQFFIGSLDVLILLIYLYVDLKSRNQKRYTYLELIIRLLPAFISFLMVLFGDLEYELEGIRYSYGPMAMTVYVSSVVYIIGTIIDLIRKSAFNSETRGTIFIGLGLWATAGIIQFFVPTSLISSLGISLMVLFLYLSFENPKEYLDHTLKNVLNEVAFELVSKEMLEQKHSNQVIYMVLPDVATLKNTLGEIRTLETLKEESDKFHNVVKSEVYRINPNTFAAFISPEKYEMIKTNPFIYSAVRKNIFSFEIPKYASSLEYIKTLFGHFEKESLENKLIFLNDKMAKKYETLNQIASAAMLAVYTNSLEVYFQPIYSTKEKKFTSAEALVRLNDKDLGFISPEIFVPILEEKGLIFELSDIVLNKVCKYYKEYELDKYGIEYIEVNASGLQVTELTYPDDVKSILDKYDLDPKRINIEITETASTLLEEELKDNVHNLQKKCFKFAMDDFGTGYSNLAKMARIHFDIIKLDKSLLWPYFKEKDKKRKAILDYSINLIHSLDMKIVAEGVETLEMVEYLTEANVEYLQGFYYSKALPIEEFIEFIKKEELA